MTELLAWYGGTFDPIHYGHLTPLNALARLIGLKRITLLPNNQPAHRPAPVATSQQRLEMLQLAIADTPLLSIDDRELHRTSNSYTIDTLYQLRQQYGVQQPLAFIIGQDSLLSFPHWKHPEDILTCAHLLVCRRPGYTRNHIAPWLTSHFTHQITDLYQYPAGKIFLANTPLCPISATDIRTRRRQRQPCDHILPPAVLHYIDQQQLYL